MHTIIYSAGGKESRILIGESIDNLAHYAPLEKSVIIADENVYNLYKERFPECPVLTIQASESTKTLETAGRLYSQLISLGVDRSGYIIGIGGGIVTDVSGFIASTFLRGIGFGFISTSLLAQVDASVGGKNGVNHDGYKNMIGTFNQPDFVICDTSLFKTLPDLEIRNGLAEAVKHAYIADRKMYDFIQSNLEKIKKRDMDALTFLIKRSVEIKTAVVTEDETEKGLRRILNFGHTLAHAIEKSCETTHGAAVGLGMEFAALLSAKKGFISSEDADSIIGIGRELNIPADLKPDKEALKQAIVKDKKKEQNRIHFVLLKSIGEACIETMDLHEVEEAIDDLCVYS